MGWRTLVLVCTLGLATGAHAVVGRDPEARAWLSLVVFLALAVGLYFVQRLILTMIGRGFGFARRLEDRGVSSGSLKTFAGGLATFGTGALGPILFDLGLHQHPEGSSEPKVTLATALIKCLGAALVALGMWEFCLDGASRRAVSDPRRTGAIVLPFVRQVGRVGIWTLCGVGMLALFNVNVVPALAGLGIGGVAVALAAKDSIENLLGALNVVLDAPFAIGDWVKIDKLEGVVEEMNLRSTRIRTFDDSLVTLPNSNLIRANVENMGQRRTRRLKYLLPFEPPEDLNQIPSIVQALEARFQEIESVVSDTVRVNLNDISGDGLIFQIIVHVRADTAAQEDELRQTVLLAALTEGDARGMAVKLHR